MFVIFGFKNCYISLCFPIAEYQKKKKMSLLIVYIYVNCDILL
jgi:hypothetical protein